MTLVTPAALASIFTKASLEQKAIQARLIGLGVKIIANTAVSAVRPGEVLLDCVFTGDVRTEPADATVLVTARQPVDALYAELRASAQKATRAGDCYGPGTIAAAYTLAANLRKTMASPGPISSTCPSAAR